MITVGLILYLIILRVLVFFLRDTAGNRNGRKLVLILVVIIGCAAPLIALDDGFLNADPVNILIAGFSIFYFSFLLGRLGRA